MPQISRKEYSSLFGPTVGDRIRLGNTDLFVEIEKDLRGYGDESIYGGGKTLPLCEVEVELKEGSREAVLAYGAFLSAAYGLKPEKASKFRRGLALYRGE